MMGYFEKDPEKSMELRREIGLFLEVKQEESHFLAM
jgi:hypothetical protein